MQDLLILIQELATVLDRMGLPSVDNIEIVTDAWQPWLEFEPVNGLTYL